MNYRALCATRAADCWVTYGVALKSVSTLNVTSRATVPRFFRSRVDSLMSSVLFGVSSPILPAATFEAANPVRVPSLFATSPEPSTEYGRTPSSAKFRPQVFATSRRLAPSPVSWACCIPLPRVGFVPFRGFSRFAAALTHRQAVPPCRYRKGRSLPR